MTLLIEQNWWVSWSDPIFERIKIEVVESTRYKINWLENKKCYIMWLQGWPYMRGESMWVSSYVEKTGHAMELGGVLNTKCHMRTRAVQAKGTQRRLDQEYGNKRWIQITKKMMWRIPPSPRDCMGIPILDRCSYGQCWCDRVMMV